MTTAFTINQTFRERNQRAFGTEGNEGSEEVLRTDTLFSSFPFVKEFQNSGSFVSIRG